ncbi:MAG TPA: efflux RND transporter periplasmic adaptor subunit [Myxococcales bacterium]|nr:efflux RND transporter periplasmic adaptor subunit [Myxococcales bacterium]
MSSHDETKPHGLDFHLPAATPVPKKRLFTIGVAVLAVLVVLFAYGFLRRRGEHNALSESVEGAQHALIKVEVIKPAAVASDRALALPGSVQALQTTLLYPRASGYVKSYSVDIGDKVKVGQVLAVIETPELDQELAAANAQLLQTQANLALTKANRNLANANLARATRLAPSGVVSKADLETSQAQAEVGDANVKVADANMVAQQANINRLRQLKAFAKVTAPFDGTITSRTTEVGSLVTAGNSNPLFRIAALDPARVFVQVPQDVAPSVRPGVTSDVTVREYPGRKFVGQVVRAAGELDAQTRTMSTEIRVPNKDNALLAGMYAEVALTLPSPHRVFQLPAAALMVDAKGQRVAVIDPQDKVHLVPVVVERDNGATLDISSGLDGTERVAKLGSAAFVEGMSVDVRAPQPQIPPSK